MFERATFRKVANLLSDAVVLTDREGRITWTNDAFHRLCGHKRSFVKGRKPGSFLQGPDTNEATVTRLHNAIKRREAVTAEILNYHESGRPYWVSLQITPVKNADDEFEGFVAIERDITVPRAREHALQHEVGTLYATLVRFVGADDEGEANDLGSSTR